jgi:hypothetical protein
MFGLALREFDHLQSPVVRRQRLGVSTVVVQAESHVAEDPGQFVADVGILGFGPEPRLQKVACPFVR